MRCFVSSGIQIPVRDLLSFDRKIQVNVTTNSNLILDRASFYYFDSSLRKQKKMYDSL